ncbi:hypothetical protein NSK_001319 [Nannochloropsis salina CCMP1776]|uniref:Uncharacterized protein n=1 Tax=Nannochloropsis salina CCMP1776 TaxID=1027361 RepID=A0A4D9DBY5_9STRA|nr:hypothetical protein NSK_001319 [Nannochloropsis salina CCMP1776]|eukprot:TFJ86985.1 hypothetical protein NSK_001319 [Nannochloropsis salina CCMP1776]
MSAQLLDQQEKDGKSYGAVAISSPRADLHSKELSWQPSIRDLPAARPTRTNSCDNAGKAFTASGMPPVTPAAASPQRIPRTHRSWVTVRVVSGIIMFSMIGNIIRIELERYIIQLDARQGNIKSSMYPSILANLLGCFIMGLLYECRGFLERHLHGILSFPSMPDASSLYVAITTWMCGSITTYSGWNSVVAHRMVYDSFTYGIFSAMTGAATAYLALLHGMDVGSGFTRVQLVEDTDKKASPTSLPSPPPSLPAAESSSLSISVASPRQSPSGLTHLPSGPLPEEEEGGDLLERDEEAAAEEEESRRRMWGARRGKRKERRSEEGSGTSGGMTWLMAWLGLRRGKEDGGSEEEEEEEGGGGEERRKEGGKVLFGPLPEELAASGAALMEPHRYLSPERKPASRPANSASSASSYSRQLGQQGGGREGGRQAGKEGGGIQMQAQPPGFNPTEDDDDVEYSIYSFRKPNQRDAFILGEVSFYTAGAAGLLALAAIKIKTVESSEMEPRWLSCLFAPLGAALRYVLALAMAQHPTLHLILPHFPLQTFTANVLGATLSAFFDTFIPVLKDRGDGRTAHIMKALL